MVPRLFRPFATTKARRGTGLGLYISREIAREAGGDLVSPSRPALASRVLFLSGDISQLAEPGNTPVSRERVLVKPVELAELERRILEFIRGRENEGVRGTGPEV